jgi:hypothetical protein
MAWIQIKPANGGGGRQSNIISARLDKGGQLSMSHAVADLLKCEKVLVSVEPELKQILLKPTTPNDKGGFALSGGGNSSHRLTCKQISMRWPDMIGEYTPKKSTSGVVFVKKEDSE